MGRPQRARRGKGNIGIETGGRGNTRKKKTMRKRRNLKTYSPNLQAQGTEEGRKEGRKEAEQELTGEGRMG